MSQVNFEQFSTTRQQLIAEDRKLRRDHTRDALSEAEAKADAVVRTIRTTEATTLWRQDHEDVPHPFPGMEFLTGKRVIVQSELYKILRKMPKGALLHAHLDATVDLKYLLALALDQPAIHVNTQAAINDSTISSTIPVFRALPANEFTNLKSLCDSSYTPESWVPLRNARENFDPSLGGPEGFDKWAISAMSINPSESYGTHNTVDKIWVKFTNTFMTSTGLIRFKPIWSEYIRQFFWSSIEDGISYVEPRINFLYKHMIDADGQENIEHREWLIMFGRILDEVKAELKAQGREDEFIGAKIIYSTIKIITPEEMYWYTNDCIALKQEFPHLIAGFDLVGAENALLPLIHYIDPLLDFNKRVQDLGLDLPLLLHAGETLGDGTEADMNLYDAIVLGTKRIGHGFSLIKHPKLMQICREKDIMLEVCPISNEVLRLTSSMPMHPLPVLLNNGIPVSICSDDPAVWNSSGLSFDFYQVLASSEITSLIMLGEMALDSLKYSRLSDPDKERAIAAWKTRWAEFVKDVASMKLAA